MSLKKVKSGGKYGYVDLNGKLVTPVEFDEAIDFDKYDKPGLWLAVVKKDNNYGVINSKGDIAIPFSNKKIIPLQSNNEAIDTKANDNYAFVNSDGVLVDLSAYDEIRPVSEGLLAAKRDGKWGYLNTKGEEAIDFKYDEAKKFIFSGKARVGITDNSNDYRSFIINKEGEEVDWQPSDWPYL